MSEFFEKFNGNKKILNFVLPFLFIFLLNGSSAFAQSKVANNDSTENLEESNTSIDNTNTTTTTTENSNVNFILWFMGTKEAPNKAISNDAMYTKKQIISSGTVPNHLLMKTLLKKTVNIKFC